ncbi:MAG: 2-keto-4-pentenoate hydratase [Bosea sp. (in: a-proteobacteria)]
MPNSAQIADNILTALSNRQQIAPLTGCIDGFDATQAYRVSRAVTARRVAQGEKVVGRKIGFTNSAIWAQYNVNAPIYGPMYDSTVSHVQGMIGDVTLAAYLEPKIEPEIVLKLGAAPEAGMDEMELMGCISAIGHGFEIVQSLYPAWVFKAPDAMAGLGMHAGLLVGPFADVAPSDHALWHERLQGFGVRLVCDGSEMAAGHGRNLLGGPVSALRHLVEVLSHDPEASPLQAGEIITTGTLTAAFPVRSGERWTTVLDGIALPGMDVTLV